MLLDERGTLVGQKRNWGISLALRLRAERLSLARVLRATHWLEVNARQLAGCGRILRRPSPRSRRVARTAETD